MAPNDGKAGVGEDARDLRAYLVATRADRRAERCIQSTRVDTLASSRLDCRGDDASDRAPPT